MSTFATNYDSATFRVVHPLDDRPEQKCTDENLGPMKMSRSVRISLFALRAYLIAMVALVFYRLLEITVSSAH
jgi:hypothetical protein